MTKLPSSEAASPQSLVLQPIIYELGVAVYLCQQFETNLLFLVSLLTSNDGTVSATSFKTSLVTYSKETLGRLVNKFKDKLALPDNYSKYLQQGGDARNLVVHGFVMRNTTKFLSPDGRSAIIDELREAQHVINERLLSVTEVLDRALQLFGGSIEVLRRETEFQFDPGALDELTRH